MNCQEIKNNLNNYLHGELDESLMSAFKRHCLECPLCQLQLEKEEKFEGLMKNHMVKQEAPYELREQVVSRLQETYKGGWFSNLKKFASVWRLAFVVMIAVFCINLFTKTSEPFPVFEASISSHMEHLSGAYPMEIVSSDTDEVSRWFEGKLGFGLKVPEFSDPNIKLVGARLCHLKDRKAAFITYHRNGQKISAFFVDLQEQKLPKAERYSDSEHIHLVNSDKGYQSILCLTKKLNGVGCIFVSDIPKEEFLNIIL